MTSAGIEMTEPKELEQTYEPGIDYSDAEVIEDLERRQFLVRDLGYKNATMKALSDQRRHKYRRRPMRVPEPLIQPKWPWADDFPVLLQCNSCYLTRLEELQWRPGVEGHKRQK